jgi:hypothetical protein
VRSAGFAAPVLNTIPSFRRSKTKTRERTVKTTLGKSKTSSPDAKSAPRSLQLGLGLKNGHHDLAR